MAEPTVFALTGNDITVTAGGVGHRAYSIGISRGANQVSARAFEDDPSEEAIVLTSTYTDITMNFRSDISATFDVGDIVALTTKFGTVEKSYSVKVTSAVKNGSTEGIADFSFTGRVLPAVSGT